MLSLLVTIIIVGLLLWAVNTVIPMDSKVKQILNVVVVVILVLWLLQAFGLISGLHLR